MTELNQLFEQDKTSKDSHELTRLINDQDVDEKSTHEQELTISHKTIQIGYAECVEALLANQNIDLIIKNLAGEILLHCVSRRRNIYTLNY